MRLLIGNLFGLFPWVTNYISYFQEMPSMRDIVPTVTVHSHSFLNFKLQLDTCLNAMSGGNDNYFFPFFENVFFMLRHINKLCK